MVVDQAVSKSTGEFTRGMDRNGNSINIQGKHTAVSTVVAATRGIVVILGTGAIVCIRVLSTNRTQKMSTSEGDVLDWLT